MSNNFRRNCFLTFLIYIINDLEVEFQRLRLPDTICLREGQLFLNQIFSCSAAFDCWDILDPEKECLKFIKSVLLLRSIRIYEDFQQFS